MRTASLIVTCLLVLGAIPSEGQEPEEVGARGSLVDMTVVGADSFPVEEIVRAVRGDLRILIASQPFAPWDELVDAVGERVAEGYRHAGYRDVRVSAKAHGETVHVEIQEGERYTCGQVRVEVDGPFPVEAFVQQLTSRVPPANAVPAGTEHVGGREVVRWVDAQGQTVSLQKPAWNEGAPVRSDAVEAGRRDQRLNEAFAVVGYPFADYSWTFEPNGRLVSDLVVHVENLGERAELREIQVTGIPAAEREALLAELELQPGRLWTRDEQARIHQQLVRAARYTDFEVRVEPIDAGCRLTIELTPFEVAGDVLSKQSEVAALLRLRDWLAGWDRRDEDLVIDFEWPTGNGRAIISPREGLYFHSRPRAAETDGDTRDLQATGKAVVATGSAFWLVDLDRGRFWRMPNAGAQLTANVSLGYQAGMERPTTLQLGAGVSSPDEETSMSPLRLRLSLDPIAFVAMAHHDEGTISIDGTHAEWTSDAFSFVFDVETGRLESFTSHGGPVTVRGGFRTDALRNSIEALNGQVSGWTNLYTSSLPVSSLVPMLAVPELMALVPRSGGRGEGSSIDEHLAGAVRSLAASGALSPLDRMVANWGRSKTDEGFVIPSGAEALPQAMAQVGSAAIDRSFPPESWPWRVGREVLRVLSGESRRTGNEIGYWLSREDDGPLQLTVVSAVAPQPVKSLLAAKVATRSSVEGFQRDYAFLRDEDYLAGEVFVGICRGLAGLSPEELKSLDTIFGNESSTWVAQLSGALRGQDDVSTAWPAVMDRFWEARWRDQFVTWWTSRESGASEREGVTSRPQAAPRR